MALTLHTVLTTQVMWFLKLENGRPCSHFISPGTVRLGNHSLSSSVSAALQLCLFYGRRYPVVFYLVVQLELSH